MKEISIERIQNHEDMCHCAEIMSTSEPWITLKKTYEDSLKIIKSPDREVFIARADGQCVGFILLCMIGAFRGYIQSIAVEKNWRSQGIGRKLIKFAEDYVFKKEPNMFLCVSSFNERAKQLYLELGYEVIGEMHDYILRGYSEILMRKTIGPMWEFKNAAR